MHNRIGDYKKHGKQPEKRDSYKPIDDNGVSKLKMVTSSALYKAKRLCEIGGITKSLQYIKYHISTEERVYIKIDNVVTELKL